MTTRLFIDLERCRECDQCTAKCNYFYHPENQGVLFLREKAEMALTCRHCEEAPCVKACPVEALEKQPDGTLKRYNLRCVSCKTCCFACPFGVLLPELVPYKTSMCDYCLDRLPEGKMPLCVETCPELAIQYGAIEPIPEKHWFLVNEYLVVHRIPWNAAEMKEK